MNKGITLVELLVILSIIGIVAGIAIPRVLSDQAIQSQCDQGARQLLASLKTARVYASTYREKTAVVYLMPEGQCYRATVKMAFNKEAGVYMPLKESTVRYDLGRDDTPVKGEWNSSGQARNERSIHTGMRLDMNELLFYFPGDAGALIGDPILAGLTLIQYKFYPDYETGEAYAHVFNPTGFMDSPAQTELFKIGVGFDPSMEMDARVVELEIQRSTGRVTILK